MNLFMPLCCVIMPFPAGKLFYLALKQVARPVSRQLQALSRNNSFMRRRILVPTGQRKLSCQCALFQSQNKCSLTILVVCMMPHSSLEGEGSDVARSPPTSTMTSLLRQEEV